MYTYIIFLLHLDEHETEKYLGEERMEVPSIIQIIIQDFYIFHNIKIHMKMKWWVLVQCVPLNVKKAAENPMYG